MWRSPRVTAVSEILEIRVSRDRTAAESSDDEI